MLDSTKAKSKSLHLRLVKLQTQEDPLPDEDESQELDQELETSYWAIQPPLRIIGTFPGLLIIR